MDKKLFALCLNEWKKCNTSISLIGDAINGRVVSFGQREILLNLVKGINRRSYRLVKILEEMELKRDEEDEIIEKTE